MMYMDDLYDLIYGEKHRTIRHSRKQGRTGMALERFGARITEEKLTYNELAPDGAETAPDDARRFYLRTDRHEFTIVAEPPSEKRPRGYLGCQAGAIGGGGRDLLDGPFTARTWCGIMADIVALELGWGIGYLKEDDA